MTTHKYTPHDSAFCMCGELRESHGVFVELDNWRDKLSNILDWKHLFGANQAPRENVEYLIESLLTQQEAWLKREWNDCACEEKWTFGVVHMKDTPCYYPPRD